MSVLDEALKAYVDGGAGQDAYYQLLLDSDFYIPLQEDESDTPLDQRQSVQPLVIESEGKYYMLLFDSEERLTAWAKKPMPFVQLAGHRAALVTTPKLHWAVNLGTGFAKELLPEEIDYLKTLAGDAQP